MFFQRFLGIMFILCTSEITLENGWILKSAKSNAIKIRSLSMLVASYTCFGLLHLSTTLTESKSLWTEFSKVTCEACHKEKRGNKWKASRRGTEKLSKGGVKGGSQTHSSLSPAAWLRCSSVEIHCYLETRTQYTLINYPQASLAPASLTQTFPGRLWPRQIRL